MRVIVILCCCLVAAGLMLSCGEQATQEQPAVDAGAASAPATEPAPGPEVVEVSSEGTVFDPAVAVDQIPDGAWYCDMGSVHYARLEKGDGRCAECGMELVQKQATVVAEEADESSHEDQG